ncbi:MAG: SIS domain-containing protein [Frankia sp.]
MNTAQTSLHTLISALGAVVEPATSWHGALGRALFVGSGDSLSACLLAEQSGHRAASAGDLAWTDSIPPGLDTVVGVSHSGRTAATVRAVERARAAGLRTVAVTVHPESPLATVSEYTILVPTAEIDEKIPAAAYVSLALGVLSLTGIRTTRAMTAIAGSLSALAESAATIAAGLSDDLPGAISVLTLPDMRSAGDFWSLKLIEATGLCARSAPLEESGHVDYFIGPQDHLTIHLVGAEGHARHGRIAEALAGNGHQVITIEAPVGRPGGGLWREEIATAAFGAYIAEEAALRWNRPPFRNGEVPMDARHIQIPAGPR